MSHTIKILILNGPRTRKFSQLLRAGKTVAFDFPHHGHAVRPIFVLWLVKISQVSSCGKFRQHLETCLLWQLKLTESVQLVMFLSGLVLLDVQNEIQLLSRVFCYSWLVCLLVFWLRNASLVKVGNPISDGMLFIFHLAWCLRGLKSLKRFSAYLIALRSCISNGKPA